MTSLPRLFPRMLLERWEFRALLTSWLLTPRLRPHKWLSTNSASLGATERCVGNGTVPAPVSHQPFIHTLKGPMCAHRHTYTHTCVFTYHAHMHRHIHIGQPCARKAGQKGWPHWSKEAGCFPTACQDSATTFAQFCSRLQF